MNKQDFLRHMDELLELEPGTVQPDDLLEGHGWSSLSVVGFMAFADEHFGVVVAPAKLTKCETANDLAALLDGKVS